MNAHRGLNVRSRALAFVFGLTALGGVFAYAPNAGATISVTAVSTILTPPGPVIVGASIFDRAVLQGPEASTVSGTISYAVYSDSSCSVLVQSLGTNLAVVNGAVPVSTTWITPRVGVFYFQATFANPSVVPAPVLSPCNSEILTVNAAPTTTTTPTSTSTPTNTTTATAATGSTIPVAAATTPTTVPSTTTPSRASAPAATTTTVPSSTATSTPLTTTTIPRLAASPPTMAIPVGAPETGGGGASDGSNSLLYILGALSLLGASALGLYGWRRRTS